MSKAEDYLKEQLTEITGKDFSQLSDRARSDALSKLFVTVAMPAMGHIDAADSFEDGYVDGSGDLGVDLLIKIGRDVHIIQTKYSGWSKRIQRDKIDTFRSILARIFKGSFQSHMSGRLLELLEDVDWSKDTVHLWFVTNVPLENQALTASEMPPEVPQEMCEEWSLTPERVNVEYIDQQRLYEILTESQTLDDRAGVSNVEIFAAKRPGIGRTNLIVLEENGLTSVIMVIESEQIAKYCRQEHKTRLFDFNIRNYLGEVRKNKQILQSARAEPESFFFYNNGVSAIAETLQVDQEKGRIEANRFSVINGAQTVRTLAKLSGGIQPKILLRVTEIPHHKDRRDLLRNVVRYNNTQNEIKSSDFRSNDIVQASFKAHFSSLAKDGKKCTYFPKRTDLRASAKQTFKIEMPNFAKAVFCYFYDPYELQAWGSGILFDTDKDYYTLIFGSEDSQVSKDDFLIKAGSFFVWEAMTDWIKEQKAALKDDKSDKAQKAKNALERKTVLIWLLHHFFKRLEQDSDRRFSEAVFLRKFAQLATLDHKSDITQMQFLVESLNAVKDAAIYDYGQLAAAGVTQRQWIRGLQGVKERLLATCEEMPNLTAGVRSFIGKV